MSMKLPKQMEIIWNRLPAILIIVFGVLYITSTVTATEEGNPNPPEEENSEFFHACSSGDLSKITALISSTPDLVHATTRDGEHCLHLSAIAPDVDDAQKVVKLLLEKGANPNIRSTWESGLRMHPLSWSTYYGRYKIVEALLEHGADINADFDVGYGEESYKATVLDVVEKILLSMTDEEGGGAAEDGSGDSNKDRFMKTRNVLARHGARRYLNVAKEMGEDDEEEGNDEL